MQNLFNPLNHITSNSKEVKNGSIFCALVGRKSDGHNFIQEAIKNGANTVIYSKDLPSDFTNQFSNIKFIKETNIPSLLSKVYELPEKIIAITGTNGKTSTCFLAAESFSLMGFKTGFIGTLGVLLFENGNTVKLEENPLTTPDIINLFRILSELKRKGVEFTFFEASSIGIEQGRIEGIPLSACCFTNFSQDHLDYHNNMESYFEAKSLLFSKYLTKEGFAVLNDKDEKIVNLQKICEEKGSKIITFGSKVATVFAENTKVFPEKITFDCNLFKNCVLNLSGKFQLENILCVISLAIGFKLNMERFKDILALVKAPKGRLEKVHSSKLNIFVDFAHTPDSLKKALETLKEIKPKNAKLLVMFGCGGDRDKTKRALMGRIASILADFVVVTDDNPRTEAPEAIRAEIISGISSLNFKEIGGRKEAIEFIISIANPEDTILLAGKGHEDYQIIGETKTPFNDLIIAEEIAKIYDKTK